MSTDNGWRWNDKSKSMPNFWVDLFRRAEGGYQVQLGTKNPRIIGEFALNEQSPEWLVLLDALQENDFRYLVAMESVEKIHRDTQELENTMTFMVNRVVIKMSFVSMRSVFVELNSTHYGLEHNGWAVGFSAVQNRLFMSADELALDDEVL